MALFYQNNIEADTRLAVWKIEEPEDFFLSHVPVKRDISHPQKRLQHLAGRYLLPFLFEDFPNREIVIADTHKPYLLGEQYHFSISHCGDYAAAIVSKTKRVGIDIEIFSEKIKKVEQKFLKENERQLPLEKGILNLQKLTTLWSAKEAIYKWWSYGEIGLKGNIHLFRFAGNHILKAQLELPSGLRDLDVAYRLLDNMSLCWVTSGKD